MPRPMRADDADEAVNRYFAGAKLHELGCSPSHLYQLLARRGLSKRQPDLTKERADACVAAYRAGAPVRGLECSHTQLYRLLEERGLKPRRMNDRSWLPLARALEANGYSQNQIAARVGVSSDTIRRAFKESGG